MDGCGIARGRRRFGGGLAVAAEFVVWCRGGGLASAGGGDRGAGDGRFDGGGGSGARGVARGSGGDVKGRVGATPRSPLVSAGRQALLLRTQNRVQFRRPLIQ